MVHADCLEGQTGAGTRALADQGAQVVRGAAELVAGWGACDVGLEPGGNPLLFRRRNPLLRHGRMPALAARQAALASGRWSAAEVLARQMEGELAHELAIHNGEVWYG
jgi:hypothetical protein